MRNQIYMLLVLILLSTHSAVAASPIVLGDQQINYSDMLPNLLIRKISEAGDETPLTTREQETGRIVLTKKGKVIYDFTLVNNTDRYQQFVLTVNERLMREVHISLTDSNGTVSHSKIGTRIPSDQRPVPGGRPSQIIGMSPGGKIAVHLEFISNYNRSTAFTLVPHHDFLRTQAFDLWINSSVLSLIIFFSLGGMAAAYLTKSRDYLYYSGFTFFSGCALGIVMGYFDYWLWTDYLGGWAHRLGNITTISILLSAQFTRSYLRIKDTLPRMDRVMRGWMSLNIVNLFVLNIEPLRFYGSNFVDMSVAASALLLISLCSYLTVKKQQEAQFMLLSWMGLLVGVCLLIASRQGFIARTPMIEYATHFGLLAKVATLGLLLIFNIKKLQEEKEEATYRAEQEHFTSEDKRLMLRVLSHDISNPLTSISMAASISLQRPTCTPEDRKIWSKVMRSAEHITGLITLVRHLEAAEAGKLSIAKEAIFVPQLLHDLKDAFAYRLADKDINLEIAVTDPEMVAIGDRTTLFHSVLGNLLSNAIKFSKRNDRIVVSASYKSEGHIALIMQDFGAGMTPEKVAVIFQSHGQTSSQGTQLESGTGFGMPIAKSFIEKMGGSISVESVDEMTNSKHHGTTFTIILPSANPAKRSEAA